MLDRRLADPDWLLDRIDPAPGMAMFVESDVERLSGALFLDGRERFSDGAGFGLPLSDLSDTTTSAPLRLILHMSFCGSSQLAQLVGASGDAVVLKEPQALVDLADWQRQLVEGGQHDQRFAPALDVAARLLSRSWPGRGPTVIKPSNWINNLIPALIARPAIRLVLVTIERRAFLRAVFRGGRERLAFTARVAAHLAAAAREPDRTAQAIAAGDDPLDRMARLAVLAHHLQQRWFDRARGTVRDVATIDHRRIREAPAEALAAALAALDLDASPEGIATAVDSRRGIDAKQADRAFSPAVEDERDRAIELHHGDRFDRALAWGTRCGLCWVRS